MKEHKVGAAIPVHGRKELIPYTIKTLTNQTYPLHEIVCIGQTDEERDACESAGARFYYYRNEPLGAKWQFGVDMLRNLGCTDFLYVGSSDWVSPEWVETMLKYIDDGIDMVGAKNYYECSLIDPEHFRIGLWQGYPPSNRFGESIGAGRILSERILNRLCWRVFDTTLSESLDYSMRRQVESVDGVIKTAELPPNASVMSVSTFLWSNMHSLEDSVIRDKTIIETEPHKYIERWFPLFVDFVKSLWGENVQPE